MAARAKIKRRWGATKTLTNGHGLDVKVFVNEIFPPLSAPKSVKSEKVFNLSQQDPLSNTVESLEISLQTLKDLVAWAERKR